LRKLSDVGSVATIVSGPSTTFTAVDSEDTTTIFESAATESIPDFVSITRSDMSGFDDRRLGSEPSEPPDSTSSACGAVEAEDDLTFMLERPFIGLETILEEEDADDSERTKAPWLSFQAHQARQTSSWRSVCGHSGPVGDPASSWPLCSPEPLSAELARTAPCAEVAPGLSHNILWPSVELNLAKTFPACETDSSQDFSECSSQA
jgi:hypothetical protein